MRLEVEPMHLQNFKYVTSKLQFDLVFVQSEVISYLVQCALHGSKTCNPKFLGNSPLHVQFIKDSHYPPLTFINSDVLI